MQNTHIFNYHWTCQIRLWPPNTSAIRRAFGGLTSTTSLLCLYVALSGHHLQINFGTLSPSTHQNMADKTTRIYNETEDTMVFVTKDQYNATRKTKKIGAGKHIDLSYRDGMVSSNPLIDIFYEIYPADRDDGWSLRENVLPIQVFDHSKIKISYNIESGKVVLAYETGGFIQRLRMVRWMKDLFSG